MGAIECSAWRHVPTCELFVRPQHQGIALGRRSWHHRHNSATAEITHEQGPQLLTQPEEGQEHGGSGGSADYQSCPQDILELERQVDRLYSESVLDFGHLPYPV